jgi:hypothetical protein
MIESSDRVEQFKAEIAEMHLKDPAAVFLRYSLAQFLRFWLARLIYEQQAQTDRVLGSARPTSVVSEV